MGFCRAADPPVQCSNFNLSNVQIWINKIWILGVKMDGYTYTIQNSKIPETTTRGLWFRYIFISLFSLTWTSENRDGGGGRSWADAGRIDAGKRRCLARGTTIFSPSIFLHYSAVVFMIACQGFLKSLYLFYSNLFGENPVQGKEQNLLLESFVIVQLNGCCILVIRWRF